MGSPESNLVAAVHLAQRESGSFDRHQLHEVSGRWRAVASQSVPLQGRFSLFVVSREMVVVATCWKLV